MSPNSKSPIASNADLETLYRAYIATLNAEDWTSLPSYLSPKVVHNEKEVGQEGYRALTPPETHFEISALVVDWTKGDVASRLDITIAGKGVKENCFYRWGEEEGKGWVIKQVWTIWKEVEEGAA